jgi:hypothetical protein
MNKWQCKTGEGVAAQVGRRSILEADQNRLSLNH